MLRVRWTGANYQLSVSFWMKPETLHRYPTLCCIPRTHKVRMKKNVEEKKVESIHQKWDISMDFVKHINRTILPILILWFKNLEVTFDNLNFPQLYDVQTSLFSSFLCSSSELTTQQRNSGQKCPSKTLSQQLFQRSNFYSSSLIKWGAVTKCGIDHWHYIVKLSCQYFLVKYVSKYVSRSVIAQHNTTFERH